MPRPQPPAGFVSIGRGVYINLLPLSTTALQLTNDSAPSVILIFGWMGGLTRHLQHYAKKYAELYPHATQIVVKCGASFFWSTERAKRNRLLPVVEALETLGCLPSTRNFYQTPTHSRSRVLVHSFSNGGGFQLMVLGQLLASKYHTFPPFQHLVSALIMDSSPAIGDCRNIGKAFAVAIRSPVFRWFALPLIYAVHGLRQSLERTLGGETMEEQYLRSLLQPRLLPWMNEDTPRLYIFSKKDEMVPWQEIQRHTEMAKDLGLNVRSEIYEESAHVAHMRHNPERYWASVVRLWKTAVSKAE